MSRPTIRRERLSRVEYERMIEAGREPAASESYPLGWGYRLVTVLGPTDSVSPLAAPQAAISVSDLLP